MTNKSAASTLLASDPAIRQQSLAGLVQQFEDAFVQSFVVAAVEKTDFQPMLIVDMRQGCFAAAVASLDTNQQFRRTVRPINVDEGDQVTSTRPRTTLSAYCKRGSTVWRACSTSRLDEVSTQAGNETALNIFTRAFEHPAEQQSDKLVAMWFPFVRMFKENKTDYAAIIIVLDEQRQVELITPALQWLSERLEDIRWQSAQFFCVDPMRDLRGFAFLNEPTQGLQARYRFLLVHDADHATEISYAGGFLRYDTADQVSDPDDYAKIGVIGLSGSAAAFDPRVLHFEEMQSLEDAAVMNYVLRLPALLKRIPALHEYGFELQETLRQTQQQNTERTALIKRLQRILTHAKKLLGTNNK